MTTFEDLDLSNQLYNSIEELGFTHPTPIQEAAYSVVRSGKDVVGIAQTGTGKTFAYMMHHISKCFSSTSLGYSYHIFTRSNYRIGSFLYRSWMGKT